MWLTVIPVVIGALGAVPKGSEWGLEELENWRTNRHHPNYSLVENDQNTEKSPGGMRRLVVT